MGGGGLGEGGGGGLRKGLDAWFFGAHEQFSRGAEEQKSRGSEEQRSTGVQQENKKQGQRHALVTPRAGNTARANTISSGTLVIPRAAGTLAIL